LFQKNKDIPYQADEKAINNINQANQKSLEILQSTNPILVDVRTAIDVVPNMDSNLILASGPPMSWKEYRGGQKNAILGGAVHEGLADTKEKAEEEIEKGNIQVSSCQEYNCVGSLAGIYTASMPVLVVEDTVSGNRSFCTLFEGSSPYRLNYGSYNSEVENNLLYLKEVIAPVLGEVIREAGSIELKPIMKRALHMGDELHSRNTAATALFVRELIPYLVNQSHKGGEINKLIDYLLTGDYFFLRLSMAAAKVSISQISNIPYSTIVSSMAFSCSKFGIKIASSDKWFYGSLPHLEHYHINKNHSEDEIEFMGGESIVMETFGLGSFAQVAAFPLQAYQGGSPEKMIENNNRMYEITVGEHKDFKIPYFQYKGTPLGIDIRSVLEKEITPTLDIGIASEKGMQIGAGLAVSPIDSFESASNYFYDKYLAT